MCHETLVNPNKNCKLVKNYFLNKVSFTVVLIKMYAKPFNLC